MKSFVLFSLALTLAVVSSKDFHGKINTTLLQGRIINGDNAAEGQFPYQVALRLFDSAGELYRCGGSLIDSEWVLTAAHCLTNKTSAIVRLGSIYFDNPAVSHIVDRKDFIPHEDYVEIEPYPNDIALIKIPKVEFTQNIQKIDLPKKSSFYPDYVGKNGIATGWGKTTYVYGSFSNILKYAVMNVISNTECSKTFDFVTSQQICAREHNSTACDGDSGGPLVLEEPEILIGIAAFAENFCTENYPTGFTRVTSHLDWIAEKTGIQI